MKFLLKQLLNKNKKSHVGYFYFVILHGTESLEGQYFIDKSHFLADQRLKTKPTDKKVIILDRVKSPRNTRQKLAQTRWPSDTGPDWSKWHHQVAFPVHCCSLSLPLPVRAKFLTAEFPPA